MILQGMFPSCTASKPQSYRFHCQLCGRRSHMYICWRYSCVPIEAWPHSFPAGLGCCVDWHTRRRPLVRCRIYGCQHGSRCGFYFLVKMLCLTQCFLAEFIGLCRQFLNQPHTDGSDTTRPTTTSSAGWGWWGRNSNAVS